MTRSLSRHCEVLVYGLKDRHHDVVEPCRNNVSLCFVPSTVEDRLAYELRAKCSQLFDIRSPVSTSGWIFPGYGRRVALALQKQQCDVIHLQQCSQYAPVIRALNPDAKIVLHLHAPWYSQMNTEMLAARLRAVDLVTTVSDFVRASVAQRFPMIAGRCETVYNGIDPAEFAAEPVYRAGDREKRILFTGAVSPHSGVHVLLEAFQIVVGKVPNVRLDIIGPPGNYPIEEMFDLNDRATIDTVAPFYQRKYLSRLKAKLSLMPADTGTYTSMLRALLPASIAGKVTFPGPIGDRSELNKRYYDADVFVFPPVCNHGFGLPPLEAMAAGTPVVASRSGALLETVVDRETGLLVAKNDAKELAQALITMLENDTLRQAMGRAARRRALTGFTWDLVAEKMYNQYQNLSTLVSASY